MTGCYMFLIAFTGLTGEASSSYEAGVLDGALIGFLTSLVVLALVFGITMLTLREKKP